MGGVGWRWVGWGGVAWRGVAWLGVSGWGRRSHLVLPPTTVDESQLPATCTRRRGHCRFVCSRRVRELAGRDDSQLPARRGHCRRGDGDGFCGLRRASPRRRGVAVEFGWLCRVDADVGHRLVRVVAGGVVRAVAGGVQHLSPGVVHGGLLGDARGAARGRPGRCLPPLPLLGLRLARQDPRVQPQQLQRALVARDVGLALLLVGREHGGQGWLAVSAASGRGGCRVGEVCRVLSKCANAKLIRPPLCTRISALDTDTYRF